LHLSGLTSVELAPLFGGLLLAKAKLLLLKG